ncbi:MAG: DEAD/DEAH box helicase, partial [Bacteroidia bacterium]
MKVEDRSKYKLVFSVSTHPQLGVMVHPYVIAYTSLDTLSLTYQKVFSGNASYYTKLSSEELELIALLDATMAENIVRTFSPVQKIRPKEFFRKHLPKTLLTEKVRPYIEKHLSAFFSKLPSNSKSLYVADEINPAAIPIRIQSEFTKVLFHFRRNENGTSYFVTIKHVEERIPFMKLGGLMPTTTPARLIVNGVMYKFYDFVDGAKIAVFLNKKFIHVKPESEKVYYDKFVKPLLETAPVFSQGFEIENTREEATPILQLTQVGEAYGFDLRIKYSNQSFPFHQNKLFHVKYNWTADGPKYIRYKRSKIWESNRVTALEQLGLINKQGSFFSLSNSSLPQTIQWLRSHKEVLEAGHFILNSKLEQTYNFQETRINYKISDKIDWFDLNVTITVGEYEISFSKVIAQMKKGLYEIDLPNGEIFVFPDEWIQLGESLSKAKHKSNTFSVKKYQVDILGLIKSKEIKAHLNSLVKIRKEKPCPTFNGTLRPYQIDGLSWLMFLFNNRFGGILADDMGLGKTVQTLAFLQLVKQRIKKENSSVKFLLIAPTSLLYNWSHEAQEFSPDLKCHIHSGTKRQKSADKLEKFDLIITSYGLIRNDSELFQSLDFDVTILDESQNIKNHSTKTTQYINKIESRCRVALTGTPIENSIRDLWSQMNFLNKGLLGSLKDFDEKYARPIEKGQDEKKAEELRKKIKPFLLRRTKSEVATELPPITEKIIYCEMTERQAEIYEETKSKYRNNILEVIEE